MIMTEEDLMIASMKKNPGAYFMLICQCTHKEGGHENNTGACSRCGCKEFKNTTHISIGGHEIV